MAAVTTTRPQRGIRRASIALCALLAARMVSAETTGDADADLLLAAGLGDAPGVNSALLAGASVEARNSAGMTPLMLAAAGGHAEVLQELLSAGAEPDAQTPRGATALMAAAVMGDARAVRVLLRAGADPALRNAAGATAAAKAAELGHLELARELEPRAASAPPEPTRPASPRASEPVATPVPSVEPAPPPAKPPAASREPRPAAAEPAAEPKVDPLDLRLEVARALNVRAAPSLESEILGAVRGGAELHVTGKVRGRSWYRVRFEGGEAYAWSEYLRRIQPQRAAESPRAAVAPEPQRAVVAPARTAAVPPPTTPAVLAPATAASPEPLQTAAVAPSSLSGIDPERPAEQASPIVSPAPAEPPPDPPEPEPPSPARSVPDPAAALARGLPEAPTQTKDVRREAQNELLPDVKAGAAPPEGVILHLLGEFNGRWTSEPGRGPCKSGFLQVEASPEYLSLWVQYGKELVPVAQAESVRRLEGGVLEAGNPEEPRRLERVKDRLRYTVGAAIPRDFRRCP